MSGTVAGAAKRKAGPHPNYNGRFRIEARERGPEGMWTSEKQRVSAQRSHLIRQYGMTPSEYDEMHARQGGACAICRGINRNGRRLSIDHDHSTGRIRGLLCGRCNTAIGLLGDDPDLVRRCTEYLHPEVI